MCGLTGIWSLERLDRALIQAMTERLKHRGPDAHTCWFDDAKGIGFGHRRLSVIDLSEAGAQPFVSDCERFVLVYNGEIYNYREIRKKLSDELTDYKWRGHSDTETLLVALTHWGIEDTLAQIDGMFSFAFWDGLLEILYLARDRFGEKPLYYGNIGKRLVFGSELKAFEPLRDWFKELDKVSLNLYLRYGYVPAPRTIFKEIFKLEAATYVIVTGHGCEVSEPICYWSSKELMESPNECLLEFGDAVTELDKRLRENTSSRALADVPIGVFLSGGVDSSTVAATLQAQRNSPIKTFSIASTDTRFDEGRFARRVAQHLGTEHFEFTATAKDAVNAIDCMAETYDEPFADASQIPTYLLSAFAREQVTVCLSGDGADELFAGYNRHVIGPRIWQVTHQLPISIKSLLGMVCRGFSHRRINDYIQTVTRNGFIPHLSRKLLKVNDALAAQSEFQFYDALVSFWDNAESLVSGFEDFDSVHARSGEEDFDDFLTKMLLWDQLGYLADGVLTKVDRASMAHSLEVRTPYLEAGLLEFAWSLPKPYRVNRRKGKEILRHVLYRYVPRELVERPKVGFGLPIGDWLRGDLRPWAEALLAPDALSIGGYLNSRPIREAWQRHLDGEEGYTHKLWSVLMFQAWRQHWTV